MSLKDRLSRKLAGLRASTVMAVLLLGLVIPAGALVASVGASVPLNSVQVTIQTSQDLPFQYTLTAYNTSGYQVAYFSGSFPEASFGVPAGTYLITALATSQQNYCYPCPLGAAVNGSSSMPIKFVQPESEYGYAVVKVTGPLQITIATSNSTQAPGVNIPVHVQYVNGTAAVGAYVSGYVVGYNYAYSQDWVTYGQTGSDGNFTLVLPEVPVQISASMSIPIMLPQNISVVPVDVGGQKVNVTVYWQPNYVYLQGQALALPPHMSAEITLKVQTSSPYPIYYAKGGAAPGAVTSVTTTVAGSAASGQSANAPSQLDRIAPFNPTAQQLSLSGQQAQVPSTGFGTIEYAVAGTAVAALAIIAAAVLMSRRNRVESARL